MRNYLCKILSLGLCLIMLIGVIFSVPLTVSAADASGNIYPSTLDGECGDNAHFYCFPDASMAIFGNGPMYDYELSANSVSTAPWYSQIDHLYVTLFINKIAIEYGVTSIGDYSFYFPDVVTMEETTDVDTKETTTYAYYRMIAQLYNVDIAYTVTTIGDYAFYNQKMEHITIPGEVKKIGLNAFKMTELKDITYYGDPSELVWGGMDDAGDNEFLDTKHTRITCHILRDYAKYLPGYTGGESVDSSKRDHVNLLIDNKHIDFVADLDFPYADIEDVDRNIGAYFGSTNSKVFGGAAPFIIVGTFNGVKKSTTYGSAGYVSCVKIGSEYYVLTNSSTGELKKANRNKTSGRLESCGDAHTSLTLSITPEYVGPDIVKMVYTLKNSSGSPISVDSVGGTGDIKIGADDKAALEPLMEGDDQVGIYMRSHNEKYDMAVVDNGSGGTINQFATFGFIGRNVTYHEKDGDVLVENNSPNANFFYGAVGATASFSATGTKSMIFFPESVFTMNAGKSVSSGDFNRSLTADSGLSYYWNDDNDAETAGINVPANGERKFAVSFSVYGVKTAVNNYGADGPNEGETSSAVAVVSENKQPDDSFYTINWVNPAYIKGGVTEQAEAAISAQRVKAGENPIYSRATPTWPDPDGAHEHVFIGWSTTEYNSVDESPSLVTPATVSGNATYYAVYATRDKDRLFKGHSLTLNGDIGVNFYLKKADVDALLDGGQSAKITFTRYVMENKDVDSYPLEIREKDETVTVNSTSYDCYKVSCNVPAAEMAHTIHAVITYGTGDESTWATYWDKDNYSVREYGMEIINNPSGYSADLVKLAKEMLNYGARAQIIFDRVDAPLATAGFDYSPTAADVSSDNAGDAFGTAIENDKTNKENKVTEKTDMTASTADFGLTYRGATVVFLSKTSLRLYYTVDDVGTAPENYTIFDRSASPRGDAEKSFKTNGDYVYAEFEDIPAAELDTLQKITVGEHTYYYSVLDYARLLFDYPEAGEHYTAADEKNFARSIYLYNHAANNYFNDFEA